MRYAERVQAAEWAHGQASRQPRRVWAALTLKPELTEQEYAAAQRGVRECIMFFPGAVANLDRVDMAWSDAALANKMDAGHSLYGLRQAVAGRMRETAAANCCEWLVQLWTLQDIAVALGHWRRMGPGREPIPDVRPTAPFVRLVLIAMADYYDACDRGAESWRGTP